MNDINENMLKNISHSMFYGNGVSDCACNYTSVVKSALRLNQEGCLKKRGRQHDQRFHEEVIYYFSIVSNFCSERYNSSSEL